MKINIINSGRLLMAALAVGAGLAMASCSSNDEPDSPNLTDPEVTYKGNVAYSNGILFNEGKELGNGTQNFHFTGDVTLEKGVYTLKGWVYVDAGAKLRIPAGTVIKGDKRTMASLIVEPGGYVEMNGTKDAPVVMTSAQAPGQRRPGDWGGLIICGKARNNQQTMQIEGGPTTIHGGDNDNDNSGIYRYVRIEFAGYPFDTDNGFSGNVEYCLSVRDPRIADTSQSNGFESDNNASGAETAPFTSAHFSHVTFIGPKTAKNGDFRNSSDYITAGNLFPDNGSKLGKFQSAMQIRRGSKLNVANTLAVGYPIGLIIDGEKGNTVNYAQSGDFKLENIIFAGMDVIGSDKNKVYEDYFIDQAAGTEDRNRLSFSHTFFLSEPSNKTMTESGLNLTDPAGLGQNYCPSSMLSDGNGGYIGAFKDASDNWMNGWTNFDPQNTPY